MILRILVVDDDPESLQSTGRILSHAGHQVESASSGEQALGQIRKQVPDLVVTDVRMPGLSGIEFVEQFQKSGFSVPFVVMTAFGSVKDCAWAMKLGAVDFLEKPFKRQALLDAIGQVSSRLGRERSQRDSKAFSGLIGSSRTMNEVRVLIDQVAKTDASVLILGESGTGKEQVARAIHERGTARLGPFVAINCAAIPENLMESELFGHEKGAFTGASHAKVGLFEAANGGTILLDEIGDMPMSLQPKLLRVLEEQRIRRVGANQEREIKVRVIAATHQNLSALVKQQRFRQDLLYRLDVMTLTLPALRDRLEDVPELTQYFLQKFSKEHQKGILGIDSKAQALLLEHDWPGNIRELSNVLERAVVLNSSGSILRDDLPPHIGASAELTTRGDQITIPLGMSLKQIEELMIKVALERTNGDRAEAARMLGMAERTIYRKISKTREE